MRLQVMIEFLVDALLKYRTQCLTNIFLERAVQAQHGEKCRASKMYLMHNIENNKWC